jgi:predicted NUDIX family phosphoesterase
MFGGRTYLAAQPAAALLQKFAEEGSYAPREQVECDFSSVQAIPAVIVRNKTGDVLRLRRRERNSLSKLHEKIVIWAGGHVRLEDGTNGAAILRCAMRELKEELRLSVEPEQLNFVGAVYVDLKDTGKHVALVYEWRASTDDVAVSLSNGEFFERRGNSLSGKFVPVAELARELNDAPDSEPWSFDIINHLLPNANGSIGHLF